jgi:arginine decarboxylase
MDLAPAFAAALPKVGVVSRRSHTCLGTKPVAVLTDPASDGRDIEPDAHKLKRGSSERARSRVMDLEEYPVFHDNPLAVPRTIATRDAVQSTDQDTADMFTDSPTPLLSAVISESRSVRANFFCPGHKQGAGAGRHLRRCVGDVALRHDVPELPALDNLFAPMGVIAEAQRLATEAFVGVGASDRGWSTFFLVNGSTCGIEAAVLSVVRPGRKILLPRNVHQSAIHALVISGAVPIWLEPVYDAEYDLVHGITPASVEAELEGHRNEVDAVLVVSPTYHGACTDIAAVAAVTSGAGVALIVDEAHGAHFNFHEQLPTPATLCGADIVVQSTHKTLGALTQAAMMHVLDSDRVSTERVAAALQLVQSTSPSYLLLSSLDAARDSMVRSGRQMLQKTIELVEQARSRIADIPRLAVLDRTCHGAIHSLDRTRLTVLLPAVISGFDLDTYLIDNFGIYAELPSFRHMTFIFTPGNTQGDVDLLVTSLARFLSIATGVPAQRFSLPFGTVHSFREVSAMTPRDAFFAPSEIVTAEIAVGRLSAATLCPYPPGIPVLVPGERITGSCIHLLHNVLEAGGSVSGALDKTMSTFRVMCDKNKEI